MDTELSSLSLLILLLILVFFLLLLTEVLPALGSVSGLLLLGVLLVVEGVDPELWERDLAATLEENLVTDCSSLLLLGSTLRSFEIVAASVTLFSCCDESPQIELAHDLDGDSFTTGVLLVSSAFTSLAELLSNEILENDLTSLPFTF